MLTHLVPRGRAAEANEAASVGERAHNAADFRGEWTMLPVAYRMVQKTCRVERPSARACSIARTGVDPIPALSSTTGPSPGFRMKLPRGELTSRVSPSRTCSRR